MDCKCRADEGHWGKSEIAVGCKCRERCRSMGKRVR